MNSKHRSLLWLSVTLITLNAVGQSVTGSGSSGTVPVFTGSSTLSNSPITTTSAGNVGIGTTAPLVTLDLVPPITKSDMTTFGYGMLLLRTNETSGYSSLEVSFLGGTSQTSRGFQFQTGEQNTLNGGNIVFQPYGGSVGIGTVKPVDPLHVTSSTVYTQSNVLGQYGFGTLALEATEYSKVIGNGPAIEFLSPANTDGTNKYAQSRILGSVDNTVTSTVGGAIYLQTRGGYNGSTFPWVNNLTLLSSGNVGIGTTSPGTKLEVDGNLKLTSGSGASITFADGSSQSTAWTGSLCGGDYAESIDVSGDRRKYEPGDVLVIDPKVKGKFLKASTPYSMAVAGVYSTKPGVIGRRQSTKQSPDEVPMAVVGIAPTKVSAENGAIEAGDVLVTSSTPGYAMKGTDHSRLSGAIVGKAMDSLASGTGVIEVLVSLQ